MNSKLEAHFGSSAGVAINTNGFRNIIEDHLDYLRAHPLTQFIEITAHDINVYKFDWIGLLRKNNVPTDLHWVVIRLNGGESYTDTPTEPISVMVPDLGEVNKLLQMYTSVKRKK